MYKRQIQERVYEAVRGSEAISIQVDEKFIGLKKHIEELESQLRDAHFKIDQYASTNSVVALESQLIALKKKVRWSGKRAAACPAHNAHSEPS